MQYQNNKTKTRTKQSSRKKQANFSNRFKYAELKRSVNCMDVIQIYRESNLNLIAAILLLLRKSKSNQTLMIFFLKNFVIWALTLEMKMEFGNMDMKH